MSNSKDNLPIILLSGGTGGHIFPAIALYKILKKNGKNVILFTDYKFKLYNRNNSKIEKFVLPITSKKKSLISKIRFYVSLANSYFISCIKIMRLKPRLIIGFGGYSTFPTLLAARHLAVKIILHEQNTIIGRVNKFYLKHARLLATSFPEIYNLPPKYKSKCVMTGNPINEKLVSQDYNYDIEKQINILIVGGSQGAASLDNIVSNAIIKLPDKLKNRLFITQQCTESNIETVKNIYKKSAIKFQVKKFFVDLVPKLLDSHLVISRAGATAISEITACNKPAIYIPYPYAKDNHQLRNAEYMEKTGSAILIEEKELSYDFLKSILEKLLYDKFSLLEMSNNSKKIFGSNAADNFFNMLKRFNYFS